MQAVTDFLQAIGNAFMGMIDFVISFFSDIVYMVQMLGELAAAIPTYFSWLPGSVLSGLLLVFTLVILYKILGREG